jgi:glycosyltransferase involved in cell wall biosynthesis
MKIVILVHQFPPKWLAGTELATYYLAENLAQRGHEIHVITSLDRGLPEESFEKGFHIHRLPRIGIRFVAGLIFWAEIVRKIKKINPDIIHVQSINIAIPVWISKKILKIPFVVMGQGSDIYLPVWFTKLTSKTLMKNADSVIALTNDMKRVMQDIYDRDIVVVPNGIDLNEYIVRLPIQRIERSEKRILFVGRLHPIKGVRYLLQAMLLIHKDMPKARLILVGDGEERDYLENLTDHLGLRECVDFVGKVPHGRIPDFMRQSDLFVLPSLSESFGIVNLEAMACRLPIVATNVAGIPDLIENGVNGYLVPPENFQEMANKIMLILKDPLLAYKLSENNFKKSQAYSWEKITEKLESIYKNKTNTDYTDPYTESLS